MDSYLLPVVCKTYATQQVAAGGAAKCGALKPRWRGPAGAAAPNPDYLPSVKQQNAHPLKGLRKCGWKVMWGPRSPLPVSV